MRVTYPVIFTEVDTNILIEVPDLGILTQANDEEKPKGTMGDAVRMAKDAIGLVCITAEDEGKELIKASKFSDIDITKSEFYGEGTSLITVVGVDLEEYRKRMDN